MTIAALFVASHGTYQCLPGVDAWDEARDAGPILARILSLHIRRASVGASYGGQPLFIKRTGIRKDQGRR